MKMTIEERFDEMIHRIADLNINEITRLRVYYEGMAFDAVGEYGDIADAYPGEYVGLKNPKHSYEEFEAFMDIYVRLSYFPKNYWFEEEYYLLHPEDSLKDLFPSFESLWAGLVSCWNNYLSKKKIKIVLPMYAFLEFESYYRYYSVQKLFSEEHEYIQNDWSAVKEIKRRKRLKSDEDNFKEVLQSFNTAFYDGEYTAINWKPKANSTGAHVIHKMIEDSYQMILRPLAISIYQINEPLVKGGLISKNEVYMFIFDCFQAVRHKNETVFQEYDPDIYAQSDYRDETDYKQRKIKSFLQKHM